jgi:hypothetical protein
LIAGIVGGMDAAVERTWTYSQRVSTAYLSMLDPGVPITSDSRQCDRDAA